MGLFFIYACQNYEYIFNSVGRYYTLMHWINLNMKKFTGKHNLYFKSIVLKRIQYFSKETFFFFC